MKPGRDWGRATRHLVAALVLAAAAAGAFYGAYWLDEPFVFTDEESGLQLKLLRHPELWHVVQARHPLDVAPGERVVSAEPVGGLVHLTVHRLSCDTVDPEEIVAGIDQKRKANWAKYAVFWHSAPDTASWRMEHSFRGLEGLKTVKRISRGSFLDTRIVLDYVIGDGDGCWWYVGAYIPQILLRYYELDVKYTLLSVKFGQ